MRIPVVGLDRSAQDRINERCHEIDGVGVTARYEFLKAGTRDERKPLLLAIVPQSAEQCSQRTQRNESVFGSGVTAARSSDPTI